MKKKSSKISLKVYKWPIIVFLILVITVPIAFTNGRYFLTKLNEFYYDSREFYFYSNVLNGSTYQLSNWDGISNYQLTIDTSNAKDNLNWTKDDINYEITTNCTSSNQDVTLSCSASGTSILVANNSLKTIGTNTITVDKGANDLQTGDTVTIEVTATSTSTYRKSLNATFVVTVNKTGVSYYIIDSIDSKYLTLVISNSDINKDVSIAIDATALNIDSTNYYVRTGVTTTTTVNQETLINGLTFGTLKNNVYSIRFYKNDPSQNYTLNTTVLNIS